MGRPKKQPGDDLAFLVPKPKKKPSFGIRERKNLVKIGKDLHMLTDEDIKYILDTAHTENQVRTRYTTARLRLK